MLQVTHLIERDRLYYLQNFKPNLSSHFNHIFCSGKKYLVNNILDNDFIIIGNLYDVNKAGVRMTFLPSGCGYLHFVCAAPTSLHANLFLWYTYFIIQYVGSRVLCIIC